MAGFHDTRFASVRPEYFCVKVSHVFPEETMSQRLQFAATPSCVGPGAGTAPETEEVVGLAVVEVVSVVLGVYPSIEVQRA